MIPTIRPAALLPYRQPIAAVVATLGSDATQGLVTAEAQDRLQCYGRIGTIDPPRPEARRSVIEAQQAGNRHLERRTPLQK